MTQAPLELPTVRFGRDTTGFAKTLRQRVDAYFKENGIHKKADARMKTKTVIMLGLLRKSRPHRHGSHRRRLDVLDRKF